jgi:hypothetical protein
MSSQPAPELGPPVPRTRGPPYGADKSKVALPGVVTAGVDKQKETEARQREQQYPNSFVRRALGYLNPSSPASAASDAHSNHHQPQILPHTPTTQLLKTALGTPSRPSNPAASLSSLRRSILGISAFLGSGRVCLGSGGCFNI